MRTRARNWRSILVALAGIIALSLAAVAPATAITDGELDGNAHPYVGLMVAQTSAGLPLWRCSGTLMSSRVFMVAGHCTEAPAARVEIWFAAGPIPLGAGYPAAGSNPCKRITGYPCKGDVGGVPKTHPQYDPNAFFLFDLGVVKLDRAHTMSQYGKLPTLNQLDALKPSRATTFTSVGYGVQKSFPTAAAWKDVAVRERMVAHPHLLQINTGFTGDFSILLSNNANTGGTCFGDSGGPNFIGTSRVIAGVTSYALNTACGGTGGVYRVDRADDLNWLATFGIRP